MCPPMCHFLTDGNDFSQPLDNGKCGANSGEVHLFLRPIKQFFETFAGCVHLPCWDSDEFQENGRIGLYNLRYRCRVSTKEKKSCFIHVTGFPQCVSNEKMKGTTP